MVHVSNNSCGPPNTTNPTPEVFMAIDILFVSCQRIEFTFIACQENVQSSCPPLPRLGSLEMSCPSFVLSQDQGITILYYFVLSFIPTWVGLISGLFEGMVYLPLALDDDFMMDQRMLPWHLSWWIVGPVFKRSAGIWEWVNMGCQWTWNCSPLLV